MKEFDPHSTFGRPGTPPGSDSVRSHGPRWITLVGVWAIVFLCVWTVVRSGQSGSLHDPRAKSRVVTPRGDLGDDEISTIEVFRTASPSVAYITNIEFRRQLFSLNVLEIPQGTGSGFIWDRDGHIVTNFHVIAGANAIRVTLSDHTEWAAKFVGGEPSKDLAVLKIDAQAGQLQPLMIGTSNTLVVGQKVFAIGNPFGLDHTLTTGVVSALGREITSLTGRPIRDVIQTDAAINPGSSGGPLLDSAGRLIGITTQIASPSGVSAGIGFAVPVDIVNRVVPEIIRHGKVIRPGLGVVVWPDSVSRELGISGVLLREVPERGSAAAAGLRGTIITRSGQVRQLGDVVLEINGLATPDQYALLDALEAYKVGDDVRVTFVRNDERKKVTVRLQPMN